MKSKTKKGWWNYSISPEEYRKIPPIKNPCPLSDELYSQLMVKAKENPDHAATPWIHLADAVSRGTVTPMEAYDCIILGYVPSPFDLRDSLYSHLL
jgi:hypothetical protein